METVSLKLKNELAEIDRVNQVITGLGEKHGWGTKAIFDLHLAMEEVIVNIISHAYTDAAAHEILVEFSVEKQQVSVRIEDDGVPFNPLERAAPDIERPLEERDIGGLGIHLVRNVMDHLEYRREGERNILLLIKNVSA